MPTLYVVTANHEGDGTANSTPRYPTALPMDGRAALDCYRINQVLEAVESWILRRLSPMPYQLHRTLR